MQAAKETASNAAASAKAGMDKTKATVQEKVDKMSAHDTLQKEMATQRKEERIAEADLNKQEAREHNAAARQAAKVTGGSATYTTTGSDAYTHSAGGAPGHPMGTNQSAVPGHGTGQPYGGLVEEGAVRTHPTGLPGGTTAHNTRGNAPGLGYGGSYSS